ncbi:conjugal transfer protein TraD [Mesorhizobium sp. B2-4-11]|uniref:conjugal transfer protein TraD n=1 Tax=Mesorhizobium sp. B2-4-11 TaxID=2589938 RepID=UPI001FEE7B01|nr:conjugal transfer protein TraD [Mesorhizobium sp. B2-4-11]
MRKPRDFDAELRALEDKARELKTRKVQQLGELVIATGADQLSSAAQGPETAKALVNPADVRIPGSA